MTTWTLILILMLPNGSTDMVVERQYWTQKECERNAMKWGHAFQQGAEYVEAARCLRNMK